MTAIGLPTAKITATIDGVVFLRETFFSLNYKRSSYIREFISPDPATSHDWGKFSLEMDLQKNFFKSMELSIDNKDEDTPLKIIKGIVHYEICEPRFRFRLRKSN